MREELPPDCAVHELLCDLAAAAPYASGASACTVMVQVADRDAERGSGFLCASSDPFAAAATVTQHKLGEGPERDVLAGGGPITVRHLAHEVARWPMLALTARTHAVAAAHCEPLTDSGEVIGVVSWYAPAADAFPSEVRDALRAYVSEISATVALARRLLAVDLPRRELESALAAREVIGQAVGILMESAACDDAVALRILRGEAHRTQVRLHTMAALVIDQRRSARTGVL